MLSHRYSLTTPCPFKGTIALSPVTHCPVNTLGFVDVERSSVCLFLSRDAAVSAILRCANKVLCHAVLKFKQLVQDDLNEFQGNEDIIASPREKRQCCQLLGKGGIRIIHQQHLSCFRDNISVPQTNHRGKPVCYTCASEASRDGTEGSRKTECMSVCERGAG